MDCIATYCHKCNKGLIEAISKTLFNFMLLSFRYLVLFYHTALSLKEIVAMHSIMLPMVSISQKKVVSAMRV